VVSVKGPNTNHKEIPEEELKGVVMWHKKIEVKEQEWEVLYL